MYVLIIFFLKGLVAITPAAGINYSYAFNNTFIFFEFSMLFFSFNKGFVKSHYAIAIGIVGKKIKNIFFCVGDFINAKKVFEL